MEPAPQAQDNKNIPNDFDILPDESHHHQMDMNVIAEQENPVNMEVENPENVLEDLETNNDELKWIEPKPVRKLNFLRSAKKVAMEENDDHQNITNQIDPIPKIQGSIQSSRVRRKNKANNLPPGSTPYLKKTRVRVSNAASENDPFPDPVSSSTTTAGFTWNNPILERPKNLEIDWR